MEGVPNHASKMLKKSCQRMFLGDQTKPKLKCTRNEANVTENAYLQEFCNFCSQLLLLKRALISMPTEHSRARLQKETFIGV